jgi:hypothetical protein
MGDEAEDRDQAEAPIWVEGDDVLEARVAAELGHRTVIERLFAWAADHPLVLVALAFLFAASFGTLYNAAYLSRFGIDFFLYAAPQDMVFGWVRNAGSRLYLTLLAAFLLFSTMAFVHARRWVLDWLSTPGVFGEDRLLTRLGGGRFIGKLNSGSARDRLHPFAKAAGIYGGGLAGAVYVFFFQRISYRSEPFLFFRDWSAHSSTLQYKDLDSIINALLIGPAAGLFLGAVVALMCIDLNRIGARMITASFYILLVWGSVLHFGSEITRSAEYQAECVRNAPTLHQVSVTLTESTRPDELADRRFYPINSSEDFLFLRDMASGAPVVLARDDVATVTRPMAFLEALQEESFEDSRARELWEAICL